METSFNTSEKTIKEGNFQKLEENSTFRFQCGANQPCFNRCCSEAVVPLLPYDSLRLSANLDMDSESFLKSFASMNLMEDSGLPLPMLRMIEAPDAPCPFVTPAGCSVYEDRPSSCRSYPLGLAVSMDAPENSGHHFLLNEEGCCGMGCGKSWTAEKWLQNEGMEKFDHFNNLYIQLAAKLREKKIRLDARLGNMFFLCLYQPERFRELIGKMKIFSRLDPGEIQKSLIMENGEKSDEALLEFAFKWLNLVIDGLKAPGA